jgi:hypothetical protein
VIGTSANGEGQGVYHGQPATYGADLAYYLPTATSDPVKIYVQNAGGDTLAALDGAKNAGLHHVTWNLFGSTPLTNLPPLGPADARDSVAYYARTAAALDSVARAGWDTTLVRHAREMLITPIPVNVNINCGGPQAAGPVRTDPNRPAEGGAVTSGNSCSIDIGGSSIDCGKWMDFQHVISPKANIQPGSCNSSFGGARNTTQYVQMPSGDYLVTLSTGGKTYRQTLRVDRAAAGEVRLP